MRRREFWDWPPPRSRLRFAPGAAPSRPTSWFDTPRGSWVARAIFRLGIFVWEVILFCVLMALLVASLWLLSALTQASAASAHEDHVCYGLWTGKSCIGTWSNVDEHESYRGDTYVRDGRVRQRQERR